MPGSVAPAELVRDLALTYARAADDRDVASFLSAFHSDAVLEVWRPGDGDGPSSRRTGHDELGGIPPALERYSSTAHLVLDATYVPVSDTSIRGTVSCEAHHVTPETETAPAHDDVMSIRYLDDYSRVDGVWRIAHRSVRIDSIERRPVGDTGES